MSQQINLLIQDSEQQAARSPLLAGLILLLVLLLGYWGFEHVRTVRMQNAVAQGEQRLLAAKANLQALQQQLGARQKAGDLQAEIAVLKAHAEASRQLLDMLHSGELGSPDGYAGYLAVLARISENGLWLTSVSVGKAGRSVSIAGRALSNEAVLSYVGKLNERFAPYGVQFTSVELIPEATGAVGKAAKPLSTVAFKLS